MLRKTNKYLRPFLFILCIIFSGRLFAQEEENLPDDELELLEHGGQSQSPEVDPSLQHDFVIIESAVSHEMNPQITSMASDSQLLSGLYEGLFSYNPVTLEPQFAIATDYRISRDKKRWTFKLRTDARFSNGEFITAEDVKYSWLQLLKTPQAPYASLLDVIKGAENFRNGKTDESSVGITVVSNSELSITLNEPANYLPKLLCHTAFSIIHRNPTVYSGAFYVDDMSEGSIVLKRNPYYWDCANTYLEQITFIQSDSGDENAFAYNTGLADWVTANVEIGKILNKNALQINAEFATTYLFFKNSSRKPGNEGKASVWDYEEFRQALFEALPWDTLRSGYYVPATTFVYPLHGYPELEGYSYTDINEAVYLMNEARSKYGLSQDAVIPLSIEVSEKTFSENVKTALKDAFVKLRVALTIREIPAYYYLNNVPYSDADVFCYSWIGDFADPLAFLELFESSSTLNASGWENAEYDRLLSQAASVSDVQRYELLGQAENLLLDSCEVIPIQHPVILNVINLEEVGGWASNAFDLHPLKYLYKKAPNQKIPNVVKR